MACSLVSFSFSARRSPSSKNPGRLVASDPRFGVSVDLTLESHALVSHAPEEPLGVILVVVVVPWGNVVHPVVFVLHEFPHEFHHGDGVHDLVIWHVVGLHVLPVLLSLEVLSVHHVVVHVVVVELLVLHAIALH